MATLRGLKKKTTATDLYQPRLLAEPSSGCREVCGSGVIQTPLSALQVPTLSLNPLSMAGRHWGAGSCSPNSQGAPLQAQQRQEGQRCALGSLPRRSCLPWPLPVPCRTASPFDRLKKLRLRALNGLAPELSVKPGNITFCHPGNIL